MTLTTTAVDLVPLEKMPTSFLKELAEKVRSSQRVTEEEGLELLRLTSPTEIHAVCQLADSFRRKKHRDRVRFASTLFIHPTNLCELNCQFCSFYAKPGWKKAWFLTPAEIEEKIVRHGPEQLTEIHIVGGLWRACDLGYYEELFRRIRKVGPHLHIKALTPVEYQFLAELHGLSVQEVLQKMISWGLGSLPGGGAEILVEEIRQKIAPGKISSDQFLEIHRLAHQLGLHSNITMLFGHIETEAHIITHLARVRELQSETAGFSSFIPLKFGKENNALGRRKALKERSLPLIYAVSRLMLDNISHLKVLWNYVGIDQALALLQAGANDLSSTNSEEKVIAMAGGEPRVMHREHMEELISSIGRIPHLTHSGER